MHIAQDLQIFGNPRIPIDQAITFSMFLQPLQYSMLSYDSKKTDCVTANHMTGFLAFPFYLMIAEGLLSLFFFFFFVFQLGDKFFFLKFKIDNITITDALKDRYMGRIEHLFEKQEEQEDLVSLKAMLIQISVNLVFTLSVLILFSWMRPRHPVIYAPKAKLSKFE